MANDQNLTNTSFETTSISVTVDPITTGSTIRISVAGLVGVDSGELVYFTLYRNVDGGGDVALTPSGVTEMEKVASISVTVFGS